MELYLVLSVASSNLQSCAPELRASIWRRCVEAKAGSRATQSLYYYTGVILANSQLWAPAAPPPLPCILMTAAKVKMHELRNMSKQDLITRLGSLKGELQQLRVAKVRTRERCNRASSRYENSRGG